LETGKHPLHIRSLVALARIERLSGHFPAARRRLEAALSACTQAASTHTSHLAATLLELGHLACAEQDWLQARQHFDEALAAKRIDAAKAQEARTGLAEVAWAENDLAQAEQLLTAVIGAPATGAATRRRAEELLMGWGLTVVATPVVSITPRSVIA
jgi:tetratricopeptide (TPR) repeat protein